MTEVHDFLDRLCLGYVSVPVLVALKKRRLIDAFSRNNSTNRRSLAEALSVDEECLGVALRLLESLGWVSRDPGDSYVLLPSARGLEDIPQSILELYESAIDERLLTSYE